jgi:hypothetical protein
MHLCEACSMHAGQRIRKIVDILIHLRSAKCVNNYAESNIRYWKQHAM